MRENDHVMWLLGFATGFIIGMFVMFVYVGAYR